jgi:hypothetical protein
MYNQTGVENEANLNWCTTALAYNYFAVSLFDRAEGGKKAARRISTVNTEDSGTTGLHWVLNVYSIRCDEVPAVNEDGAAFAHEEGDSDSETEWAVLMALGDRNTVAAKKKGKKKEKKHRR